MRPRSGTLQSGGDDERIRLKTLKKIVRVRNRKDLSQLERKPAKKERQAFEICSKK
jgi:hypothetical protein